MKRFVSIWIIALLCAWGCHDPKESIIKGKTTETEWNGKTVELTVKKDGTRSIIGKSKINDGKFEIRVVADTPFIATLRIEVGLLPYILPVAVEPGQIHVLMGQETRVSGTPLNTRLQQFMVDKDDFISECADTLQTGERLARFKHFIEAQIEKNKDNFSLAKYIREMYGSR